MLDRIRIVLIGTSHPGNIGGVARAMHNMGLADLALVAPRCEPVTADSVSRASGADHLVHGARVVETLEQAVADCTLVVGASARSRTLLWPMIAPRALGARLPQELAGDGARVALVFGREDSGLTNAELQRCHAHVHIPTNPDFSSLNLAAAVQVLAYECRLAWLEEEPAPTRSLPRRWPPTRSLSTTSLIWSALSSPSASTTRPCRASCWLACAASLSGPARSAWSSISFAASSRSPRS